MGVEESRSVLERLEHLATGLGRLPALLEQPGEVVMNARGIGLVEEGERPVFGHGLVALAEPFGREGKLAVRGRRSRGSPRAGAGRSWRGPGQSLAWASSSMSRR